jgi:hypothetical protein
MACGTRGWEYRLAVKPDAYASSVWDGTGEEIYFPITCGLMEVQEHVIVPGTRGSRALFPDQTVRGNRQAGGSMRLKFGPVDLDKWLPRILGAAEDSNEFKVANTVPWFNCLVDKGQGKFFEYRDCKVARATFSGQSGGVVDMMLDIVAKKEEEYTDAWPTISFSPDLGTRPLRFAEGSLTIDSINILFESFSLVIDNLISPRFYAGDDAATCVDEDRRIVTLSVPAAHTSVAKELYKRGFEGLAGAMAWSADNMSTSVALPMLHWAKRSNTMEGDGDTPVILEMLAYRTEAGDSGADDEITITNDPIFAS